MKNKPNCRECQHRRKLENNNIIFSISHRSMCVKQKAIVTGHPTGIAQNQFNWPDNFDPDWLTSCDSFERKEE